MERQEISIKQILDAAKVIAVVGLSRDPSKTSRRVTAYIESQGYEIIPINPTADEIMGRKAYPSLSALPEAIAARVDMVNIFRPSHDLPAVVDDALASIPNLKSIWAQLGIAHDDAQEAARRAGIDMVQDRCIMVEHRALH